MKKCDPIAILNRLVKLQGLRATAREYRIDPSNLCAIMSGRREIPESLLERLGVKKVISYYI